jgi:aspartyl/asparaginyl beta-hydroxylase (cupin superfamily)
MFLQILLSIIILVIFIVIFYKTDNSQSDILKSNLQLVEKFSKNELTFNIIKKPNTNIVNFQSFYDISVFPQLQKINYKIIKNEFFDYQQKSNNDWIDWAELDLWKNNKNSSWKIIPLMAFGNWSPKNKTIFPETVKQLEKINGLVSAGFSKLGSNTTLALHKGWGNLSNNVLRCHLGISVPVNKCSIFVIGNSYDKMIQKEGKWIIFDDSLYHSASNEDEKIDRIVLILDIKRPEHIPFGISDVKESDELLKFLTEFNKN